MLWTATVRGWFKMKYEAFHPTSRRRMRFVAILRVGLLLAGPLVAGSTLAAEPGRENWSEDWSDNGPESSLVLRQTALSSTLPDRARGTLKTAQFMPGMPGMQGMQGMPGGGQGNMG